MSSDPSDLQALTPAHFLVGGPIIIHPSPDLANEEPNSLRRTVVGNTNLGGQNGKRKKIKIRYLALDITSVQ